MDESFPNYRTAIMMLGVMCGATGAMFLAVQGELAAAARGDDAPSVEPAPPEPVTDSPRGHTILIRAEPGDRVMPVRSSLL